MNTLSRRSLLAGTATLPTLSLPAIATSPADPVFAAIERHREAWTACLAAEPAPDELMGELCEKASDAYADLLALTPTSAKAATAALLYVAQHENEDGNQPWTHNWGDRFCSAGHDFLPRIASVLERAA